MDTGQNYCFVTSTLWLPGFTLYPITPQTGPPCKQAHGLDTGKKAMGLLRVQNLPSEKQESKMFF